MSTAPLNATAASLLGFLQYGPRTGWQLAELAQLCLCDFWNLTRSQVYRELRALAERDLVVAGAEGARAATPYTITDLGRAAFAGWLNEEPAPEIIRAPFAVKLFFGEQLDPETRRRFVQAERTRNASRLHAYQRIEASTEGVTNFAPLLLQLGIRYRTLIADWLDDVEETIDRP